MHQVQQDLDNASENDAIKEGLAWVGVLEECDCCHEEFPMSWIVYNGIQFLCYACAYGSDYEHTGRV